MKNDLIIYPDCVGIVLRRTRADSRGPDTLVTLIDKEDLARAEEFPRAWCAQWNTHTQSFYVHGKLPRAGGKQRTVPLHRWLFGLDFGDKRQIDHIHHDTLDNRRANLRIVSHQKNACNLKRKPQCSSRYLGVSRHKTAKKWRARIRIDGKQRSLGLFDDESEAAQAYRDAEKALPWLLMSPECVLGFIYQEENSHAL